ncbi:MAG TPA: NAD(P)/FAD-dependent oxidoreductase [Thermoprotei archaeon]|nr:NAD(P)/FAD-dependent oxidoreductase [Thermoprotei archaeon]
MLRYDVVIVGAGPSGIFAAMELSQKTDLKILLVDKGRDLGERICNILERGKCLRCKPCNMLSGWGGAGAFSDGKLNYSLESGGWLPEIVPKQRLLELMEYVDKTYLKYGAPTKIYEPDPDFFDYLKWKARQTGLKLVYTRIRHMGSDGCKKVLLKMKKELERNVDIMLNTEVREVIVKENKVRGVELADGKTVESKYVILAPGRGGAEWLKNNLTKIGVKLRVNPVDLGVRVEVPAEVMEDLTSRLYEPKFIYYSKTFDDKVRTFCVNPYGEVIAEVYEDIITVNGHSYEDKKTDNTNFAILVSTKFTEPFEDPIAYGKYIARLANIISGGVIVQRLGDFLRGRRSTKDRIKRSIVEPTLKSATPGDLSFVLPYRYLVNIKEMLNALNKVVPGVYSDHTLLYGVEVKFYSLRVDVNEVLETTNVRNLYCIGDGSGLTRGLVQASISGVIAARSIIEREGYPKTS